MCVRELCVTVYKRAVYHCVCVRESCVSLCVRRCVSVCMRELCISVCERAVYQRV